ncbi:MAG: PAS domain S-box protein [Chthoniobacterales bacterium]
MSLRLKALLVFSLTLVLLFGIIVIWSNAIIDRQFTTIERERVIHQSQRFSLDLQSELGLVASAIGDLSLENGLYEFSNDRNSGFIENNLNEQILNTLHLDFIVLLQQNSTPILTKITASGTKYGLTPSLLLNAVSDEKIVPQDDVDHPLSGFLQIGDQIAMISAQPVVHSSRPGQATATLIGGKILSAKMITDLEKRYDYHVKLTPQSSPSKAGINPEVAAELLSGKEISTVTPIRDIHGKFIATAEIISTNSLREQAVKTIRIFLIGLASSAGILLFVVWYLLDSEVINPVQKLAAKLAVAAAKGQLPSDLGVSGQDELANLAHRIEDLARSVAYAEASYRAVVEDQTDFIFRYQPDGRITFVNEALCRYFGKTREQILSMNAKSFVIGEDSQRVDATIKRLSAEEPVISLDHRVVSLREGVTWFRRTDRAIFSDAGTLREVQCVASDITHAHLARELLRASEVRYRRLFETATDGILIIKKSNHVITDINPALCRMLDCAHSILIDQQIESTPPFQSSKTHRSLGKLLDEKSPLQKDEMVFQLEAGPRYFEVTTSIYEVEGENVVQFNFRDITTRKQVSDELRELSGHLLRSQDEERRRIARELHDSTAQNLSALQMAVTKLESSFPDASKKAEAIVQEIRKLADLSSQEIRTISYLLHPPLLDEAGLLFALRWYVDGFITRTEIIVRLDLPSAFARLPSDIETTIFRVVQEGLRNIHRHSGSRLAWIRLTIEEEAVHLEIRDEGRGLLADSTNANEPSYPMLGVGITGMRERLRQFNGSLEIESGRQGTIVRAILPLKFDENTDD